ncbi:hypothetical protein Tco_1255816 [Tanacetum coccineum]
MSKPMMRVEKHAKYKLYVRFWNYSMLQWLNPMEFYKVISLTQIVGVFLQQGYQRNWSPGLISDSCEFTGLRHETHWPVLGGGARLPLVCWQGRQSLSIWTTSRYTADYKPYDVTKSTSLIWLVMRILKNGTVISLFFVEADFILALEMIQLHRSGYTVYIRKEAWTVSPNDENALISYSIGHGMAVDAIGKTHAVDPIAQEFDIEIRRQIKSRKSLLQLIFQDWKFLT